MADVVLYLQKPKSFSTFSHANHCDFLHPVSKTGWSYGLSRVWSQQASVSVELSLCSWRKSEVRLYLFWLDFILELSGHFNIYIWKAFGSFAVEKLCRDHSFFLSLPTLPYNAPFSFLSFKQMLNQIFIYLTKHSLKFLSGFFFVCSGSLYVR